MPTFFLWVQVRWRVCFIKNNKYWGVHLYVKMTFSTLQNVDKSGVSQGLFF